MKTLKQLLDETQPLDKPLKDIPESVRHNVYNKSWMKEDRKKNPIRAKERDKKYNDERRKRGKA